MGFALVALAHSGSQLLRDGQISLRCGPDHRFTFQVPWCFTGLSCHGKAMVRTKENGNLVSLQRSSGDEKA